MKAKSPKVVPQITVAFAPTVTPFPTFVGAKASRLTTALRGLMTFVKTQLGPRKTSSPRVTPWYRLTLFCILQFDPVVTPDATNAFWPRDVPVPSRAFFITWQKCQTLTPSPSSAPSSMTALSCTKALPKCDTSTLASDARVEDAFCALFFDVCGKIFVFVFMQIFF